MSLYAWIATVIALTGTVLNCRKNKLCFYFWLVTNAMWFIFDISNSTISRAVLDIVQLALAIYGIYEWRKINGTSGQTRERNTTQSNCEN